MTNLTIKQGETFRKKWTWCSGADVTKTIASITRGYPTVLSVTAHGLPTGPIPVAIVNADDLETASVAPADRVIATKVDTNTLSIDIDSSEFATYTSGGVLIYTPPVDLTTYSGRCMVRQTLGSATTILDVDNIDTGIVLGGTEGTVELVLTAAQTAALTLAGMVFDVEVESGAGVVTRIASGTITLDKEVTHA